MSKFIKVFNIFIILGLIACSSPTYLDAEDDVAEAIDTTTDLLTPAHIIVTDEAFIDAKPIFQEYYPSWTEREVSVDGAGKTVKFKALMDELFKANGKIHVIYQDGIEDQDLIDFSVNGKLIDVIKVLSKTVNYHYLIDRDEIVWTLNKTRLFQLGVLPGNYSYDIGSNEGIGGKVLYNINGGNDSVWDKIDQTIKTLKSETGQFVLNKESSYLTVVDRPNNMAQIADFVQKFNNYHMQQVGIKVQVLEVQLDEQHKRGIDWSIIRTTDNSEIGLNMNLGSPPNTTLTDTVGALFSYTVVKPGNEFMGSAINLLQFIEQQGNVAIISEPRFTILNNQAAEIKISDKSNYVKSSRNTLIAGGGSQVAIETDELTTGFYLYIVPTIFDDEVLLQISTSLSRKLSIDTFSSGLDDQDKVQLPNTSDRRFTQRSLVPNNSTLVLTGFKELESKTGDVTPFKINLLGGQSASKGTTEIVVLVTPVIIQG